MEFRSRGGASTGIVPAWAKAVIPHLASVGWQSQAQGQSSLVFAVGAGVCHQLMSWASRHPIEVRSLSTPGSALSTPTKQWHLHQTVRKSQEGVGAVEGPVGPPGPHLHLSPARGGTDGARVRGQDCTTLALGKSTDYARGRSVLGSCTGSVSFLHFISLELGKSLQGGWVQGISNSHSLPSSD